MTPVLLCLGLIVGVIDGDTIKVRCDSPSLGEVRVRLAEIDAPEKRQPYGQKAKQALSDLAYGKTVELTQTARDRYNRVVARVKPVDGTELNFRMVEQGYAWCYRKYLDRKSECDAAEMSAREAARGLWADGEPVPPWEWRHAARDEKH